ncbi:hypothetical protein BH24CHL5_BH24CHL5_02560 [soil metagenome]
MRLPDILGVFGALVVGGLLTVLLLVTAVGEQPALPTPVPPTLPPLPTATPNPAATPGATAAPSGPSEGVGIGMRAPEIEVILTDGSVMNTSDFAGRPLWINFMATWCPQCVDELPMMERYERLLEGQMTILAVDVAEDRRTVVEFVKALDVDLPVGLDEDGAIQAEWGAYALPIHFWIDESGVIQEIVFGGAPPEIFIQAITKVVPEFSAEE